MTQPPQSRAGPCDVYVALGGNVGDVLAAFRRALAELERHGVQVLRLSSAYRTIALTLPGDTRPAPDYWNAVCQGCTALAPRALLDLLQQLEVEAGRVRGGLWIPRPLDLDLLLYGDAVIREPELQVPHPRLAERGFVLWPLAEIAPDVPIPPGGSTARELLARLPQSEEGILARSTAWY